MAEMTFIEARARLLTMAAELRATNIPQLKGFAKELEKIEARVKRRPPERRAMPRARLVDDVLRDEIRAFGKQNPTMSFRKIGAKFNVDGGRVSEAMHGFRDAPAKEDA